MPTDRAEIARRARECYERCVDEARHAEQEKAMIEAALVAERDAALAEVEARLETLARGREHLYDPTYSTVDECANEVRRMRAALKGKGG